MSDSAPARDTVRPILSDQTRAFRLRPGTEGVTEFLAFRVGGESYAFPLNTIREILKAPPITEVPRAPKGVLGIISVRGRVTTVVDLRAKLKAPPATASRHTRILLADAGQETLGVVVDAVLQVYRLTEDEVETAAVVGGDLAEYVVGIGRPHVGRALGRGASSGAKLQGLEDILILLDPRPLLRR